MIHSATATDIIKDASINVEANQISMICNCNDKDRNDALNKWNTMVISSVSIDYAVIDESLANDIHYNKTKLFTAIRYNTFSEDDCKDEESRRNKSWCEFISL